MKNKLNIFTIWLLFASMAFGQTANVTKVPNDPNQVTATENNLKEPLNTGAQTITANDGGTITYSGTGAINAKTLQNYTPATLPVGTATQTALAGKVTNSTRSKKLGASIFGMTLPSLNGTTFAGYTWQRALSVPSNAVAARLVFANTQNNTVSITGASVGTSSSGSSLLGVSGTTLSGVTAAWKTVTFDGGSATKDMVATALGTTRPVYYKSDWMQFETSVRSDGGSRGIILARCTISGTPFIPASGSGNFSSMTEANSGQINQTLFQSGSFLASSFTAASDPGACPILGVEFMTNADVVKIVHFGDSIDRGQKSTPDGNGWGTIFARLLADEGIPATYESCGYDGLTVAVNYTRWLDYLMDALTTGAKPTVAIFRGLSTNTPGWTAAHIESIKYYTTAFIRDCQENGIIPVVVTCQPHNSIDLAADNLRKLGNAWIRSLASDSVFIADIDAYLSDGASPARFVVGLVDADGIHPNLAGDTAVASGLYNTLLGAIYATPTTGSGGLVSSRALVAPAGTLTGTTLAANVVSSSLTSTGTLSSLTVGTGGTSVARIKHGTATLVAGTVTVSDTNTTANTRIFVNRFTDGGTRGASYSVTRSAGASFTITSYDGAGAAQTADTSVVAYQMIEP